MMMDRCIPKIIHLLVKDKMALGGPIAVLHPGWELRFYDDEDISSIMQLHFPELVAPFSLFPKLIQRLDVFRMLIVYLEGGFYMDTDISLYKPLDDLLDEKMVLGEEKTLTPQEMTLPHHKDALRIANYMFGAKQGHPFLIDFARVALSNHSKPVCCENDILEATGPGLLTGFYHEKGHCYDENKTFKKYWHEMYQELQSATSLPFRRLCRTSSQRELEMGINKMTI